MYLDVLTVSSIVPELLSPGNHTQTAGDHSRPNVTTVDHSQPNVTTVDHSQRNRTTVDHSGRNMTTVDHSRPNVTIVDHSRPNMTTVDHSRPGTTTVDHSGRNMAAGADQSDQMAAAASSPQSSQDLSNNTRQTSYQPNSFHFGTGSSCSNYTSVTTNSAFTGQEYSLGATQMNPYPLPSAPSTNAGFYLTPLEPGNVLDELSAMFENTLSN